MAQQQPADDLQEVTVTGSRVIREGMSSPTPVTSLSSDELLHANPQSVAQALALLPSMGTSTTPKSVGGRTTLGPGSFLNLRNLGSTRNLVLLDGRRVVPSNIAGNTDINLLPSSLIKSVSVVTGGASAAYGSDAIAGVTNFILDTKFDGVKFDFNSGASSHDSDGASYRLSAAWGGGFLDDRVHAIASFDWRHSQPAYQENRGWANQHCGLISIPGVTTTTQSATNPRQTIACNITQASATYGGAIIAGPLTTATQGIAFDDTGRPVALTYGQYKSTNTQVGGQGALWGDVVNFTTPMDNKVGFAHVDIRINENVEAFVQGTFSRAQAEYAQTPAYFYGTGIPPALTIFSGNPFIPTSIQARMTQLNLASFALNIVPKSWGNISVDSGYESWDTLAGLKGKIGDTSWTWDAHYEHGRSAFRVIYHDMINLEHLYRAADVVQSTNGQATCYSATINPTAYSNCVPLNPFGQNSASGAALDYIHGGGVPWNYNIMAQDNATASVSGTPFSTWAGDVSVAGGLEWRKLQGRTESDAISHNTMDFTSVRGSLGSVLPPKVGGWATTNLLETSGEYTVKEGFVETLLPLLKDLAWTRSLDLNAAARVTDYSQSGRVETWKVGVTWRPIDELLVRATRSRDIRAPGIGDLYAKDSLSPNVNLTDRAGTGGLVSIPTSTAGNPTLKPEKADTTTFGFTYQPGWLQGFGLSVDYYDIEIKDALASVGAQETIDRCAQGQQQFCALLIRNGTQLVLVRLPTQNLAAARSRGIDVDGSYHTDLFGGRATFRILGTRLLEQSTSTPNLTGISYSDRVGDMSTGYAKWLVNGSVNYDNGPFGANIVTRYISSGRYNATYKAGDIDPAFDEVASMITMDFGVRYKLESVGRQPELYLNLSNAFDKSPPLVPPAASLIGFQTASSLYDTMGRYVTAGVRLQF
jgi:outer membrane receptor protein involved in Fe transport